jgi:hypothetical protein
MARPKRKMSQAATIEALKAAVEDVRLNGRAGRTIPEIAAQHRVNPGSLKTKIVNAGLTHQAGKIPEAIPQVAIEAESPSSESSSPESSVCNSLQSNLVSSSPTKSVENWGNEGCAIGVMPPAHKSALIHAENASQGVISEADRAILDVKAEVAKECKRLLREARRMTEIKSVRDLKTVYDLCMDALGAGKDSSSKQSPLIQVQILGDSGNREPRLVRAIEAKSESIKDSGNDADVIEAVTLDT